MANFDYPWDKEEQTPEEPKTTKGGEPTKEEFEKAIDNMFNDLYYGHWRKSV